MSTESTSDKFYFNVRTRQVEQGPVSPAKDRLGPYDSHDEATKALDLARSRSVEWDEQDEEDEDWGTPASRSSVTEGDHVSPHSGGSPTGIDLDAVAEGRE